MEESSHALKVSVADAALNDSKLNTLTREIASDLNRQPGVRAEVTEGAPRAGGKGDPLTIGAIALHLLGSGGAVAVFLNGLKAYFLRRQSLAIEVTRADGAKFALKAENLDEANVTATTDKLLGFLKDGGVNA